MKAPCRDPAAETPSLAEVLEWDVASWTPAVRFWQRHTAQDLSRVEALELGSRNGGLSLWLAAQGARVLCTDLGGPRPRALEQLRRYGYAGRVETASLDALDIPDVERFDVVAFKSVLGAIGSGERRDRQERAVRQIHRCLKPGGELFFAENLAASPLHRYLRSRFVAWGRRWRYVTLAEVQRFLEGFASVRLGSAGFLGALGRSEGQRAVLGRVDRLGADRLVPAAWRYVVFGVARK